MPEPAPRNTVTEKEYDAFQTAYDWFNRELFDATLPGCLITFQSRKGMAGYYWHDRFHSRRGKRKTAEIALNPETFTGSSDREILSTLVHEMVHLWQACFGKPGRARYHNKQWAAKMKEVGLMPSHTGKKGGKETGDQMSDYVIEGGPFANSYRRLLATGFRINWQAAPTAPKAGRNKVAYACPRCGTKVWGHAGLGGKLLCVPCDAVLEPPPPKTRGPKE
jgi:predicted SprT family Zn-dependent metalloprotease